jgi:hypothetical protein
MITTNFHSLGLAEKRANHVMFVAYQDDLVDRADIYAVGLERLHRLCVDGIPKGMSFLKIITKIITYLPF